MKKIIIPLIIIFFIVLILAGISRISSVNFKKSLDIKKANTQTSQIQGIVLEANELKEGKESAKNNTIYLQNLMDKASKIGGATIKLPSGEYYFGPGGLFNKSEAYALKCMNNVTIIGAGTNENDENTRTTLLPYLTEEEATAIGLTGGSMDMFFYNDYSESSFNNPMFLENANYKDFIINGKYQISINNSYNTTGKGFMINLYKNCNWENVVVKNTIATGFGMDCPINCSLINCKADNCGRGAKITSGGASGFGIGTGYSNNESIYIYNCEANNCRKYGFFFEHQGKFKSLDKSYIYSAQRSNGFVVSNCTASGNTYDFGGERTYDVTYENCTSIESNNSENFGENTNLSAFHFQEQSIRCNIINCTVEKMFNDVKDSEKYYYKPARWALKNGIIDTKDTNWNFVKDEKLTRGKIVLYLHRLNGIPGDKIVYSRSINSINKQIDTGFEDVEGSSPYALAAIYAKKEGIIKGTSKNTFSPDNICDRGTGIIMLYRYAGSPDVDISNNPYTDISGTEKIKAVIWAKENGITSGTTDTTFSPNDVCTNAMFITWLYRMNMTNLNKAYNITYNLLGETVDCSNPNTYTAGEDSFQLAAPTKTGYIFNGWTGSNIEMEGYSTSNLIPNNNIEIKTTDAGNKIYSANWTPIKYKIIFNANGGNGHMEEEIFEYDVPQTLFINNFVKEGYKFTGWNTEEDGSGEKYGNAQAVMNLSSTQDCTINLYAQWIEKNSSNEKNIFIGDSGFVEMRNIVEKAENENIWIAKRGEGIKWFNSYAIPYLEQNCEINENTNIIIKLGENDLFNNKEYTTNNEVDVDKVVEAYVKVLNIKAIEWAQKGAHLYFCSGTPVNTDIVGEERKEKRIEFDGKMKQNLEGYEYIDYYNGMINEFNKKWVRADGSHGVALFYSKAFKITKDALGQNYIPTYEIFNNMTDVDNNDEEYINALKWAYENVYINPISDNEFGPNEECTRADIIALLWRTQGTPCKIQKQHPFTDVNEDDLYYEAVNWGYYKSWTLGKTSTSFCPKDNCTFKEFFKMLYNTEYNENERDSNINILDWADKEKMINGDSISLTDICTRKQTVICLYRFYINNPTNICEIHQYNEGEIILEPTCMEPGIVHYVCTLCGAEYEEEIEALGHNYINNICTICGKIKDNQDEELYVNSKKYITNDNIISKIQPKTTIAELISNLEPDTNATEIKVYKGTTEVDRTEKLATGMKIIFIKNEKTITYEIAVQGDINGDSEANFKDIIKLNKYRLKKIDLGNVCIIAGDVSKNGKIDFIDMVYINKYRLKKINTL